MLISPDYRRYGVPTIRTDLPAPRIRRVDDRKNYGDESDAYGLVNPSLFSQKGVYEKDFLLPRSKEEVKIVIISAWIMNFRVVSSGVTHRVDEAYIGALSICSVFDGNVWSLFVEETMICTRDLGKTMLFVLAAVAIPYGDTGDWTQDAKVESQGCASWTYWTGQDSVLRLMV